MSLTPQCLQQETVEFRGTGGISTENSGCGFCAAFIDTATDKTVVSCFADGRPAPVHVLDGLPNDWISERDASGTVVAVIDTVVPGFLKDGRFYTREQAAAAAGSAQHR